MAIEISVDLVRLQVRDFPQAAHELPQTLLAVQPHAHPVKLPVAKPRQVEGRLPQRLGGKRARVDGGPADLRRAFDEGDRLAVVGGLSGAFFARGSRTHDDEVEVLQVRQLPSLFEAFEESTPRVRISGSESSARDPVPAA